MVSRTAPTARTVTMIKRILLALLLLTSPAMARSSFHAAPLPYSCSQVQWATSHFTPEQLRQVGKDFNIHLSRSQLAEAKKCLAHD